MGASQSSSSSIISKDDEYHHSISNGHLDLERDSFSNTWPDVRREKRLPTVKCYQKLVLVLAMVSIVLCIVVLSLSLFLFNFKDATSVVATLGPNAKPPIACLECKKLIKNPSNSSAPDPLLDSLTHKLEEGIEMCCAFDSQQMSVLLELSMRKQEVNTDTDHIREYDAANFTFSPVSAHKRLYPPAIMPHLEVPKFEKNTLVTLHFKKENDYFTEHARGVDILRGGLRITRTGLYYVYSSIHFRPESVYPCKAFRFQTWGHYIHRLSPNRPSKTGCLLKTAHTCCDNCTKDEETSYTSGVFFLNRGDVIQVEVSGHGLVFFRKYSSFVGLMMLGSGTPSDD